LVMSLTPPPKVRKLQDALHSKANLCCAVGWM
jgi:hypothetical protein